jgi:CheY-like chemotaxis protein
MENKKKILVIDDSTTNAILMETVLSIGDYHTQITFTVKEALAYLEKNKPDLILLDLLMPFVDGFEFLNIIKGDKRFKNIPIIVVSAVSDPIEVKRAKSYGIKEYIYKPINIKVFTNYIDNLLGNN